MKVFYKGGFLNLKGFQKVVAYGYNFDCHETIYRGKDGQWIGVEKKFNEAYDKTEEDVKRAFKRIGAVKLYLKYFGAEEKYAPRNK